MYERFGSMQMTRGWIEEGGEFIREAKTNLQASIGRWKNDVYKLAPKLLITCNPSNNFLYTDYYKPWKENKLPPWRRFVKALPQDNKTLPDRYIEGLLQNLTQSQIERLVFGNWEYDDDPNWLVDYDAVCDMFSNEFVLPTAIGSLALTLPGKVETVGWLEPGTAWSVGSPSPKASRKARRWRRRSPNWPPV
jgi:hypothetical protein